MSFSITEVRAWQIFDSRGNPTLEVEVELEDGGRGRFSVPSGASKGEKEAVELRDGGRAFKGKGVLKAVRMVRDIIRPAILGEDARMQARIDEIMVRLDGTPNKSRLGANSILGVSIAVAKAAADQLRVPLYRYIGGIEARTLPIPMMNLINGGIHAGNELSIQEFLILPLRFRSYGEALNAGVEIYMELREVLRSKYGNRSINVGDEGGFAPPMSHTTEALEALSMAIENAGYGGKVAMGLDIAAGELYNPSSGKYKIDGRELEAGELLDYYGELLRTFPIMSIEDPFHPDDWDSLIEFTGRFGSEVMIVGDDYFATNPGLVRKAVRETAGNSLLLKVNQVGTLTEALEAARIALRGGFSVIVSHRSGETLDPFIADLSVAINCGLIKAGAPARGERIAKYLRLLEIERELGSSAKFGPPLLTS